MALLLYKLLLILRLPFPLRLLSLLFYPFVEFRALHGTLTDAVLLLNPRSGIEFDFRRFLMGKAAAHICINLR